MYQEKVLKYMKKKYSLRKSEDFQTVLSKGRRFFNTSYTVYSLKREESNVLENMPRIGISVGKKKFKRAVDRNYYKRVTKSIIGRHMYCFKEGYDYVLLVKPAMQEQLQKKTFQQFEVEFIQMFSKYHK